jgi:hypothetical protein
LRVCDGLAVNHKARQAGRQFATRGREEPISD